MKTSNNKKFSFKYIVWLVAVAFLITSVVVLTKIINMNILPTKFLAVAIAVIVFIIVIDLIAARKLWPGILTSIISIALIAVMIVGVLAINKVDKTVDKVTDKGREEKTEMVIAVLKDSQTEDISDLSELLIG